MHPEGFFAVLRQRIWRLEKVPEQEEAEDGVLVLFSTMQGPNIPGKKIK